VAMPEEPVLALQQIEIGGAQIHLVSVRLREDILLDEVHLEGGDIRVELPAAAGEPPRLFAEGTVFRAMMTEVNLNRALAANPPPGGTLKNLRVAVLSGKLRLTGQIVKGISLPFTIEGTASDPQFRPDVKGIAAGALKGVGGDAGKAATGILKGILGGKKP